MKKIIYISHSSSGPYAPENLLAINMGKMGYIVVKIHCEKIAFKDMQNIVDANKDAICCFTYGRGCFPVLSNVIKDLQMPKVIWMPSIITESPQAQKIVKEYLIHYDTVYTCLPTEIPLYKKLGVDAKPLFAAVDETIFKPSNVKKDISLGFLGRTHYESRKKLLNHIIQRYKVYTGYSETEYIDLINRTEINLNCGFFDFGLPNRIFDVLSCGGFLLSYKYEGVDNIFEDGQNIAYFTYENIYDKIEYYMNNPEERKRIGENGRQEVISKHTYKHRIKKIIDDLEFN